MRPGVVVPVVLAALVAAPPALAAPEGRFDAQVFRPLAAPRDLVMVPKSEVIGHFSPVVGVYWDAALDPLALVIGGTGRALDVVGARLTVTPLLGVGLFEWAELTAAIPLVAWQTSENLRSIGTEGTIGSEPHVGDIRLQSKVELPIFNRQKDVKVGFGLAVAGNINLPTGDPLAFSGDGALSGGAQIIADYRFNFGMLVASNLGVWIRPEHQFANVRIGDMAQFGVAAEMYVWQRRGVSIIGELYGYPSLTKFSTQTADQIPAEVLLGVRWQTRQGITVTLGGSFGAACGFGAPALRLFNSVTFQLKSSNEQKEINRILDPAPVNPDPDHDDLREPADECPNEAGPPENNGCPEPDRDGDGVIDDEDRCPDLAPGPDGFDGCPPASIKGDEIVTAKRIPFWAGFSALSGEAREILQEVLKVIRATPTIRMLEVRVHTDARESGAEGIDLSMKRAEAVGQWLLDRNPDGPQIAVEGYGHQQPATNDSDCLAPDEELSEICKWATRKNQRVIFKVLRWGAPPTQKVIGKNTAGVLPRLSDPGVPQLRLCRPREDCLLPFRKSAMQYRSLLPDAKEAEGKLPEGGSQLPSESLLPEGGSALPNGESVLPKAEDGKPEGEDAQPEGEDAKPEGEP